MRPKARSTRRRPRRLNCCLKLAAVRSHNFMIFMTFISSLDNFEVLNASSISIFEFSWKLNNPVTFLNLPRNLRESDKTLPFCGRPPKQLLIDDSLSLKNVITLKHYIRVLYQFSDTHLYFWLWRVQPFCHQPFYRYHCTTNRLQYTAQLYLLQIHVCSVRNRCSNIDFELESHSLILICS